MRCGTRTDNGDVCGREIEQREDGRWMHRVPRPAESYIDAVLAGGEQASSAEREWGAELGLFTMRTAHQAWPAKEVA